MRAAEQLDPIGIQKVKQALYLGSPKHQHQFTLHNVICRIVRFFAFLHLSPHYPHQVTNSK
jgi:hypothetical protein